MNTPHPLATTPGPRRRIRPLALVAAALVLAAGSFAVAAITRPANGPAAPAGDADTLTPPGTGSTSATSLERLDGSIAVWAANLEAEPRDFVSALNLGELSLARLRLSDDIADADRARAAADAALATDPDLAGALVLRSRAAHAAHDFADARTDALAALERAPGAPLAIAALGDAELELGDYDAAWEAYDQLAAAASGPAVDARLARVAAVTGNLAVARDMASSAARAAAGDPTLDASILSWYRSLEAALAFQDGDLQAAERSYRAALAASAEDVGARIGLARVLAATGDLSGAESELEASIAVRPDPAAQILLGDLRTVDGDPEAAASLYRVADAALSAIPAEARELALLLADHGLDTARAVELAETDLERRADTYAYDTLAWALFADGRFAEADAQMARALAAGTEDARLDYHAGMIAAALGRDAEARQLLEQALARNEGFDILQADRARAVLAGLGG